MIVSVSGITDSNPTNNNQILTVNTTNTNNLVIHFVMVSNDEGIYPDPEKVDEITLKSYNFTKAVYPIADDGLIHTQKDSSKIDLRTISSGFDPFKSKRRAKLLKELSKIGLTTKPRPNNVVGIVPEHTLSVSLSQSGDGFADKIGKGISSVIEDVAATGDNYEIVTHEISHNYGLCDEYSDFIWNFLQNKFSDICPNGDDNDNELLDNSCEEYDSGLGKNVESCRAPTYRELHPFDDSSNSFEEEDGFEVFRSFMGTGYSDVERYWVGRSSYNYLFEKFKINESKSHGDSLLISALVYKNGSYNTDSAYKIDDSDRVYVNETGNYSLKLKSNGTILFQNNFSLSFIVLGNNGSNETNISYIVFTVPYYNNITSIEFSYKGQTQEQINSSPNTPSITLIKPMGGEVYLNPFNVSWNASDADNDSLIYLVQISEDNGSNWTTIAVDLNVTYLELENADFSYGTDYKVKVYVSDGINTNSSESSSNFTIVPPPSVSVNSITEVYSLENIKIYEVEVENDGGQALNYLQWRFNTGLENITNDFNISLEPNEKASLLLEINYASGGWMNVSLFAWDDNKSVNDTYSELFFVGDLRVGGFKQLYGNATLRAFEFLISNQGSTSLSNVMWSVDTGDGVNFSSVEAINLSAFETAFFMFEHNFSDTGSYNLTVNVSDSFNPYDRTLDLFIPDIVINNFRIINQSDNIVTYGFGLENMLNKVMNASYILNTGVENISNNSISINPDQEINFSVDANYTSYGDFTVVLNASDNYGHSKTDSLSVSVNELLVTGLQKLYSSETLAVFEFIIKDLFSINKTFTWSFDTNDTAGIVWSDDKITLTQDENISILLEHNFSSTGTYEVSARANTTSAIYSESLNVSLS